MQGDFGSCFLLGDAGYQCTNYMLTPLAAPRTPGEERYQATHIYMRNAIERLFGVIKRRFPSLVTGLQIKVETVLGIIVACCIIHNIAVQNNDFGDDFEDVPVGQDEVYIVRLSLRLLRTNLILTVKKAISRGSIDWTLIVFKVKKLLDFSESKKSH